MRRCKRILIFNLDNMVNRADQERRQAWHDLAAGVEKPDAVNPKKKPVDELDLSQVDENTGTPLCPEYGKLYNPNCGNCYHSRFRDEYPLQPHPDVLKKPE